MDTRRRRAAGRGATGVRVPSTGWIDISVPLRTNMVHWPGDPPVRIERVQDMDRGGQCNVSQLSMSAHTGTHMDAPLHFLRGSTTLDAMPLSATIGPARVIAIRDGQAIRTAELRSHRIQRGERILFRTRNSTCLWETNGFAKDFVYIAPDAAEYLARRRVRTVGVDYLSVGGFQHDGDVTHLKLLGAGIWIIEGLNLGKVRPGPYELICLPLKIQGGDGGPARAIVHKGVR